jgi:hypothetical protein
MTDQAKNQHEAALSVLREHAGNIRGGARLHAPVPFRRSTWDAALKSVAAALGGPKISVLDHIPGATIDRNQIRSLARDATTEVQRTDLFVATMVWSRGTANGRMMPGLVTALSSPQLHSALHDSAIAPSSAEAYQRWTAHGVPGLGEAFFTKWLWAASLIPGSRFRGLVLDSRVWRTLNEDRSRGGLGWSSIVAAGGRRRHLRYQAYVEACREWAASLECDPEDIEYSLFAANGDLSTLTEGRVK